MSEETPSPDKPFVPSRADVCLITGATGFIGGHLARRLSQSGYPVRCLTREGSDRSLLDRLDVQIVTGDLRSAPSLARAAEGCRYVFHCGALVSDWATKKEITDANVEGTRNMLEASSGASVARFIHLSTTDVYGYPDTSAGIDETYAARGFRNWYAQTKVDAEREVRRVEEQNDLDTVVLRPATVYGPGSTDVIGEIARAIQARHMLLIDGGRAVAGLCFVENLIDAMVLALRHDAAPGQTFNVSDGLDVTWKDLTDGLAEGLNCPRVRWSLPYRMAIGIGFSLEHAYRLLRGTTGVSVPALLSRQAVHVLGKNQDFSNRKLREMLGWAPRVAYAAGLEATLAWLRTDYLKAA